MEEVPRSAWQSVDVYLADRRMRMRLSRLSSDHLPFVDWCFIVLVAVGNLVFVMIGDDWWLWPKQLITYNIIRLLKRGVFEEVSANIPSCSWYGFGSGSQDFIPHIPFHVKGYCHPAWTVLTECSHSGNVWKLILEMSSQGVWVYVLWPQERVLEGRLVFVLLCATIMRIPSSGLSWVKMIDFTRWETHWQVGDLGWSLHLALDRCHVTTMNANGISRTSFRFPMRVKHHVSHIVSPEKRVKHIGNF